MDTLGKKRHLLSVILIMTVSTIIYINTLKNGFVYDDRYSIVNNELIKSFVNLPKLFSMDYFYLSGELSYRPVVTLSYFFDYALFGLSPWGYHMINVLIHAANAGMAYIFISLIAPLPPVPQVQSRGTRFTTFTLISITLLFATHPILTEAVNAVSFREDLLAFLFYIGAFNLYLLSRPGSTGMRRMPTSLLYGFSCLLYFLSLLSKEMAATFPLVVCCYEWIYNDRRKPIRSMVFNPVLISYIAVTVVYLYLRFFYFHNPKEEGFPVWGISERVLTLPWLLVNYLKFSLFPVSLSADYYILPVKFFFSKSFLLPFIAMLLFLASSIAVRDRDKSISFGMVFFIVTLMPVYNLAPIANPLAERYLYLPALGFSMAAGFAVNHFCQKDAGSGSKPAAILLLAAICINSASVVHRNIIWRDDFSLWSDAAKKVPNSSRPYNDIGNVLYQKGLIDDAVKQYQIAIRLNPNFLEPHNNLGMIYASQGKFDDAVNELKIALRLNPEFPEVLFNLGKVYDNQGKLDDAVAQYKSAIRLSPGFTEAHYYLGVTYLKKGMRNEARREFEMTLRINPNFPMAPGLIGSLKRNN